MPLDYIMPGNVAIEMDTDREQKEQGRSILDVVLGIDTDRKKKEQEKEQKISAFDVVIEMDMDGEEEEQGRSTSYVVTEIGNEENSASGVMIETVNEEEERFASDDFVVEMDGADMPPSEGLDNFHTEQERLRVALQEYTDYLQDENYSSENKLSIIMKGITLILSFLSSKAYVSGCKEAFPNREILAYITAFCSAVTSALPTLWAWFAVIDRARTEDEFKKDLLDLDKDCSYYSQHILPVLGGALASIPFAGLTALSSTGGILSTILWTLNSWCVNTGLTIFALQNLMIGVPRKLELSKEEAAIADKIRTIFLKRLKEQQWRFPKGDFDGGTFNVPDVLAGTTPGEQFGELGNTIASWTGRVIAILGLIGYASVDFSFLNAMFTIPIELVDVITKSLLTAATMVPFASLFINSAAEVFSSIYTIVESLYEGRFGELIEKNPAYQFHSKAAVIGTVALMTMASLSGVTNGNMTRELATAFFEKISFGTVHIPVELANFFGADAYFTSAMFNGSASIFGAYFPFLAATLLVRLVSRYLSWNASPEEVKTAEQRASKLQAFNTTVGTLEEMALEDIVLIVNGFDVATRNSLLEEAGIDLSIWSTLVVKIEAGFAEREGHQNNSSSDPKKEDVITAPPIASLNSDLPAANPATPLLSKDKEAQTPWGAVGMFFNRCSSEKARTPMRCFPCCPMSV